MTDLVWHATAFVIVLGALVGLATVLSNQDRKWDEVRLTVINHATCSKCGAKRKFEGETLGRSMLAMVDAGWRYTGEMLRVVCDKCQP